MKRIFTLLLAGATLFSSGCATIVGRSTYPVRILSTPDQATVIITTDTGNEVFKGQTPATALLRSSNEYFKKASYIVKIQKEGYDEQTFPILATLNNWYFGNIVIGGLIGLLIIDPLTGAMYKIDTDVINTALVLQSAALPSSSNERELRVMNIDEVPENLKANLIRVN